MIKNKLLVAIAIALICSCRVDDDTTISLNGTDNSFEVSNESEVLTSRVSRVNKPIAINLFNSERGSTSPDITLTLVNDIASPKVNGLPLMATSISEHDGGMVVSYNTAGAVYMGGASIINRNEDNISIQSEVIFSNTDVSHSILVNDQLYLAGAVGDSDTPSMVGLFTLSNGTINENTYSQMALGGFVATSLINFDANIYATSGAGTDSGSGFFELNPSNLTITNQVGLSDPRWSAKLENQLFVQNGIPGSIEIFEGGINAGSINISDADIDAKASFDIADEYLFAGVGRNGVEIFNVDGTFEGNILLPEIASPDFTTNAVAVYGDMVFIANGTRIFVATYLDNESSSPEVVGELELGDFESINHIVFQDNYLVVAAGLGGVKVIRLDLDEIPPQTGAILSKADMQVIYFDSEEPKRNRFASYVLDDDINTFWHTEWVDQDPDYPHELWIDLGKEYELSEFRYRSRQWGNFNGTVSDYELYISNDTAAWGDAFQAGSLERIREEQIVLFDAPVRGRFFRFLALSEVNGNPWASCSEINFVGIEAP